MIRRKKGYKTYVPRTPNTGGQLNVLNGKMRISAPCNSVPVSKLVRIHKPKSAIELEELIKQHYVNRCDCGIISKGTVEDFGKNLYDAQKKYWGDIRFTLKECIQWEYDLFILNTLKGNRMEVKCKKELIILLSSNYNLKNSSNYIDEELRVDIEVLLNDKLVAGIQVKPSSYNNVRNSIKDFNKNANNNYCAPVFYIFYENDIFLNINEIAKQIKELNF